MDDDFPLVMTLDDDDVDDGASSDGSDDFAFAAAAAPAKGSRKARHAREGSSSGIADIASDLVASVDGSRGLAGSTALKSGADLRDHLCGHSHDYASNLILHVMPHRARRTLPTQSHVKLRPTYRHAMTRCMQDKKMYKRHMHMRYTRS